MISSFFNKSTVGSFEAPVPSGIVVVNNTPIANDFQSSSFIIICLFVLMLQKVTWRLKNLSDFR